MTDIQVIEGEELEYTPRGPMTLFGTDDPVAVVERASAVATSLAEVIKKRKLTSRIQGKDHVQIEGWTLLGSMLGVFAVIEWARPIEQGYEARAVVHTLAGNLVGAAEAMCTRREGSWKNRDDYALRSMAQTRAVSKALRMPLGFIMHLAGYSATPAEEMGFDSTPQGEQGGSEASVHPATTPVAPSQPPRALGGEAPVVGGSPPPTDPVPETLNDEQIRARYYFAQSKGWTDEQLDAASVEATGVTPMEMPSAAWGVFARTTVQNGPGDVEPPKPGTGAYKALEPLERSAAKAYWTKHPAGAAA